MATKGSTRAAAKNTKRAATSSRGRKREGVVSLADEDVVKEVLVDSVLSLWDAVNGLTRLQPSQRGRYSVTIFGSARLKPGSFGYEETKRVAAALARMGCDIVTGGGPGLMQAANEGAASARGKARSLGIRVHLPFEQESNAFVTESFEHRTFFTRLHQFVLTSDAFVVAPGGIGTVLELVMVWQLLQVNHLRDTPLVLIGNIWHGLVEWAKDAMLSTDPPLASAKDLAIPQCVADGDAAVEILRAHRKRWQQQLPKPRRARPRKRA